MNHERQSSGGSARPAGDRRWEDRRQDADPVPSDRRTGSDRRDRSVRGSGPRGLDWLDRVSQTLQKPRWPAATQRTSREPQPRPPDAAPPASPVDTDVLVTARHGIVGTVYAAWERVARREQDGGRYRVFHGEMYRQIGSAALQAQSLDTVDDVVGAYEGVYARAYELIYQRHPRLRARGQQREGTIVLLDRVSG